jgi:hypothetical protein
LRVGGSDATVCAQKQERSDAGSCIRFVFNLAVVMQRDVCGARLSLTVVGGIRMER